MLQTIQKSMSKFNIQIIWFCNTKQNKQTKNALNTHTSNKNQLTHLAATAAHKVEPANTRSFSIVAITLNACAPFKRVAALFTNRPSYTMEI